MRSRLLWGGALGRLGDEDVPGLAGDSSTTFTFTGEERGPADSILGGTIDAYAWHPETVSGEVLNDCNLGNNSATVPSPCSAALRPAPLPSYPDLVGEITNIQVSCNGGDPIYESRLVGFNNQTNPPTGIYEDVLVGETPYECEVRVTFTVINVGGAHATSSHALLIDRAHGVSESGYIGELEPEEGMGRFMRLTYVLDECRIGDLELELIVDTDDEVDEGVEGGEDNNTSEGSQLTSCI